ncbi:MAG: hypothetical protein K2K83_05275 [Rikenella sp.]|nr:hypothetical protein [Rikenella sp.]
MRNVGTTGLNWSSTVSGFNVCRLHFNDGGVYPQRSDSRAYGLPLRCLQE